MLDERMLARHIVPMRPIPTGLASAGQLPGKIDCVLFDVYGTLLISGSGDLHGGAAQPFPVSEIAGLLREFDLSDMAPRDMAERFRSAVEAVHRQGMKAGIDYPEVIVESIWQDLLGIPSLERAREFAARYEMIVNPVFPMPGLRRLLAALRQFHLPLGIISNAQFYTPVLLMYFLKDDLLNIGFFNQIIIYSYLHGRAKPSPALFRLAAENLQAMGIGPERVLFVGNDMRNDIVPARQVGFATALFIGDRRSLRLREDDPEVTGIAPDIRIHALMDLPGMLKRPAESTRTGRKPPRPHEHSETEP